MIYIITHKRFAPYFTDELHYRVLHVGENGNTSEEYLSDSDGDSISDKNAYFCELTGLYWIWKNGAEKSADVTGLVHYRRYFTTRLADFLYTYFGKKPKVLPYAVIEKQLKSHDVLLPIPERIYRTVRQSYVDVHNEEDLVLTKCAIEEVCPDYVSDFERVMNSHQYYYANMMICSKTLLDAYAEWLFGVLSCLEKKINISKYAGDSYQERVFGFLSERLLQVWVLHNQLKIKQFPAFNTESRRINAFEKNRSRIHKLWRKLKNKAKQSEAEDIDD